MAVVMGCATSDDRFSSARGLLDFGFANYMSVVPPSIADQLEPVPVLKGVENEVAVTFSDPGSFVIEKGTEDALNQEITLVEDVAAPVEAGQVLGKVDVVVSGEVVGSYDLKAAETVERMTIGKAYQKLLGAMLRMNRDPAKAPDPVELPDAPDSEDPESEEEVAFQCTCEEDGCYCEQIGDVCGCTKQESKK